VWGGGGGGGEVGEREPKDMGYVPAWVIFLYFLSHVTFLDGTFMSHVTFLDQVEGNSSNPVWRKTLSLLFRVFFFFFVLLFIYYHLELVNGHSHIYPKLNRAWHA
jgi:hypothetical protein